MPLVPLSSLALELFFLSNIILITQSHLSATIDNVYISLTGIHNGDITSVITTHFNGLSTLDDLWHHILAILYSVYLKLSSIG